MHFQEDRIEKTKTPNFVLSKFTFNPIFSKYLPTSTEYKCPFSFSEGKIALSCIINYNASSASSCIVVSLSEGSTEGGAMPCDLDDVLYVKYIQII